MGSLLERLEAREAAVRTRVEALRAEMAALAERLADQEELLGRLEVTRRTVIEVLAGNDDPDPEDGATAMASTASAVVGMGVQVPAFSQDGDRRGLPVAYRDVVEVLASSGVPLRATQVCQALGREPSPGTGKGCAPSSSGWPAVVGWSRSSRVGLPAPAGWWAR